MTSPGVSPRSLVFFSVPVLGSVIWLSYAFRFLLGSGMATGWLEVGVLLGVMAIVVLLLLREVLMAVKCLRPKEWMVSRKSAKIGRFEKKSKPTLKPVTPEALDRRTPSQAYRIVLGLEPRVSVANRRRAKPLSFGRSPRWQGA